MSNVTTNQPKTDVAAQLAVHAKRRLYVERAEPGSAAAPFNGPPSLERLWDGCRMISCSDN
jgi:hypothetical protein